jgi:hypothetical protein
MTDDRDDISEALDGDKLGEGFDDADLPGIADYPPEHSMGVEDPSLEGDDDLATRELRRDVDDRHDDTEVVLVDEQSAGALDDEPQELGSGVEPADSELSAEEAAIHVEPDDRV